MTRLHRLIGPCLLLALAGWAPGARPAGCSCYSPEMREKAARDSLEQARTAVFGRVSAVDRNGAVRVEVLESFKGPPAGAVIVLAPGNGACATPTPREGDETLVLSFQETMSTCEAYDRDHFLLEEFRARQQVSK